MGCQLPADTAVCVGGWVVNAPYLDHGIIKAPHQTFLLSTPAAPGDYQDRSYQVEFNVTTQSGTLVVYAKTDNILENDEDFKAVLSVPAGLPRVLAGTPSEANVTILDRTAAEVYFDPDAYHVMQGQTANLILKLTTNMDPSLTIIMFVNTIDGSAKGMFM